MVRNSSLLWSIIKRKSTFYAKTLSSSTWNPFYGKHSNMETIRISDGSEKATQRVLTRNSLKSECNEFILNPGSTRTGSAVRAKFRQIKPMECAGKSESSENTGELKEDLIPSKKKRGFHQKCVSSNDKCLRDDVKIHPRNARLLKTEVTDLSQTKEKPSKKTKVTNGRAKSGKIIKMESKVTDSSLTDNQKFVGAHLSIAGGLYKCIEEAVRIGARSCGLFLKSQRQWASKPLTAETIEKFKDTIEKHNFPLNKLLPHGSYLINCGSPNVETLEKSRAALIDELQRCELLGIQLYNFHPGSTCGKISREECIDKISESINLAHSQTNQVTTVIENMSGQGNTIGGKLEELKSIIDRVKDKSRIGVCIDTCHAFAAGYDVSSESGFKLFIQQLDEVVGLQYLKAVHLNDSKGKLGCHLDRHENIGKGYIGIEGFRLVMKEASFNNLPMILETPMDLSDEEEIRILNSL